MDWVKATLIGVALVGAAWAAPILGSLLSVLLTPVLILVAAILGICFLLQILKDDDGNNGSRRGP